MKLKKIKPLYTRVITTADRYEEVQYHGSLVDVTKTEGALKEIQKVIAVGDSVRNIKEGDMVQINPINYKVTKYDPNSIKEDFDMNKIIRYDIPMVELGGKLCLMLQDRDIDFVVVEYEEEPVIVKPHENKIITSASTDILKN